MKKIALHWQILIAIILAALVGLIFDTQTQIAGIKLTALLDLIGTLFLNGLKLVVVPLVLASIICAMAGFGNGAGLGRLGAKTLAFYLCSSLVAILIGLFFVNVIKPGIVDGEPARALLNLSDPAQLDAKLQSIAGRDGGDFADIFLRMLPPNIVEAAASGQMLGLICFGLLFGYFMTRIAEPLSTTMQQFWQGVFDIMMHITLLIMKFAPIGVFGLIGETVLETGFDGLRPVLMFMVCVLLALATHAFVALPLALKFLAKVSPWRHMQAMSQALLTAFSTASSSGTLPLTMECVEKKAGVSNKTAGFVLPLGATVNMDGTALYECVAAMFIAQAYGLELGFATQFLIVLVALLTSVGVAGIPSASLVAITVILASVGLPPEGIGALLVTDRILDMLRTAVNVFSDSCCAVVMAKSEGETNVLVDERKLSENSAPA